MFLSKIWQKIKKATKKSELLLVGMLVVSQFAFAFTSFIQPADVIGAVIACDTDSSGANDEPGQKDLTKVCYDETTLDDASFSIDWGWDDTGWTGNNTGDSCVLFDTDGDGFVNYAVCVTVEGDPATEKSTSERVFSCGDTKIDRCTSPATVINGPLGNSTDCVVTQAAGYNPFDSGTDTKANCLIYKADIGNLDAQLVDVCSFPSDNPNSDPSDCIFIKAQAAKLEVVKNLEPSSDAGLFNLRVDGVTQAANVGDGGSTGELIISVKSPYSSTSVSETAGTSTILASYSSSIECRDGNGTGSVVASTTSGTSLSFALADQSDVVCVITNELNFGTITLNKTVTNDDGGDAVADDFQAQIDGNNVSWGISYDLVPGNYVAGEIGLPGYEAGEWTGDCDVDGDFTITSGANLVCSIENDDIAPTLTLVKYVVNTNGGNLTENDFQGYIDLNAVAWSTAIELTAGAHTASETDTVPGYLPSVWSGDCADDGTITLALDEDATCYVTNTSQPASLTLHKTVTNNYGGQATESDFTPSIDGNATTWDTEVLLPAGDYEVSESGLFGYGTEGWTGDCDVDGDITLEIGEEYDCYITNSDIQPQLTVVKTVVNDDGGQLDPDDFTINVTGTDVTSSSFLGSSTGTTVGLDAGSYSVDEDLVDGYTPSYSADCTGNLGVGETATCYIENDDVAPLLTLVKNLSNDDGGDAVETDWTLYAIPQLGQIYSGLGGFTEQAVLANTVYDLAESTGPDGYEVSIDWSCDGGDFDSINDTLELLPGDDVTCDITNDDIAPTLTVIKNVVNDNGGDATVEDFDIEMDDENLTFGAGVTTLNTTVYTSTPSVQSNQEYSLSEIDFAGYSEGTWSCDNDTQGTGLTIDVTLNEGEDVICTITNDDISPQLTVTKIVTNDNGGLLDDEDFTMYVTATNVQPSSSFPGDETGTTVTLNAGSYSVSEDQATGYEWPANFSADCEGTIALAEHKYCVVTNDDQIATLTVIKTVINDDGGTAVAGDFDITVTGTDVSDTEFVGDATGTVVTLDAGSFDVTESDYSETYSVDYSEDCSGNIANGENLICTITNDDIAPTLTLVKNVTNDNGGDAEPIDWTLSATSDANGTIFGNGSGDSKDSGAVYDADAFAGVVYTLGEAGPDGYSEGTWSCNDGTLVGDELTLEVGDDATCEITNDDIPAGLTIVKFHDEDEDGEWDEGEPFLSDWVFHINDNPTDIVTGENGETGEELIDVNTTVNVYEDVQDGWRFINSYCSENAEVFLNGEAAAVHFQATELDSDVTCYFANAQLPYLEISKTNDTGGTAKLVGDEVVFTIVVTNPIDSGILEDVKVTDVLQDGFEYDGIWGSIGGGVLTTAYNSPGIWNLGTMNPGDEITLFYTATIGNVIAGEYPDTAFATGQDNNGFVTEIYSNCYRENSDCVESEVSFLFQSLEVEELSTPFVGTLVAVAEEEAPEVGFVLGETLVKTGIAALLPAMMGSIIALTAFGTSRKGRRMFSKLVKNLSHSSLAVVVGLVGALVLSFSFSSPTFAIVECEPGLWSFKTSTPESVLTNDDFNFDYVLSSTNPNAEYLVELFLDGSVVASQTHTSGVGDLGYGSDSGSFNVDFLTEGAHTAQIKVNNCGDEDTSDLVNVTFDTLAPDAPDYGGAVRSGNQYTINFTAPSGDVSLIQIFAINDIDAEFKLDATTLVGSMVTTPGQEHNFVYNAPDATQRYFAVVAYDDAGNASQATGDEIITTIIVGPTGGPVTPATEEGEVLPDTDEDGEVLPDTDENDEDTTDDEETDEDGGLGTWWIVAIVAVLGFGAWYMWSKSQDDEE